MGTTRVFVSHSYRDKTLAARFVRAIEAGIKIRKSEICCTSLPGYALPIGRRVSSELRQQIEMADVVVGLLTPKSLESSYVLYELGAAWGKGKRTFPILAKGVGLNRLPELVKELTVERLSTAEGVEHVIDDLAAALNMGVRPKNTPVYKEAVQWLVRVAKPPKKKAMK